MKKMIQHISVVFLCLSVLVQAQDPAAIRSENQLSAIAFQDGEQPKPEVRALEDSPKITIKRIRDESVQKHKSNIKSLIKSNKYKSYGLKGAFAVSMAYLAYKMYQGWTNPELPVLDADIARIPYSENGFTQIKDLVMRNREATVASFGSWLWVKRMGSFLRDHVLSTLAVSSVWSVGEKYIEAVNHPESIAWFEHTQTNYTATFDELRQFGIVLDSPQFMVNCSEMHAKMIAMTCNSLVAQVELILAYMEHKQEQLTGDAVTDITELMRYMFNCTNEFAERMEVVFNDTVMDCKTRRKSFESAVNGYKKELDRTLLRHHNIEKEQTL